MPLVTVDDLKHELSGYTISDTSNPSTTEVTGFIADIETEVSAYWTNAGGTWPVAGSPKAAFPVFTIKLGAKWRFLDAKFATAASGAVADALAQARLAYNDRLNRIAKVVAGAEVEADVPAASNAPLGGVLPDRPGLSFGEWTVWHDPITRHFGPWRPNAW